MWSVNGEVVTCYGVTSAQSREIFKAFYKENLQWAYLHVIPIETSVIMICEALDILFFTARDMTKSFMALRALGKQ